jgi:FkbM family methyltransferase
MLTRNEYINRPVEIEKELLGLFNRQDKLVIFDVGACEAEDSIRYSMLFPDSTIYAFEPRTDNCEAAKGLIKQYNQKNIILEQFAFSNQNGTAEFHLSEGEPGELINDENWNYGNKSSSLLPPSDEMKKHTAWLDFKKTIQVETKRMDDYVREKNIQSIDFMHIDVQGAEMMVFNGAGDFIRKIKLIWTEVEAVKLYQDQPVKDDIELFMRNNGFVNILDTVDAVSGDQLYVNKKYFSDDQINLLIKARKPKNIFSKIKSLLGIR